MSKYIFMNELGGYESAYDKNSLMRLCYEEIFDLEAKLAESENQNKRLYTEKESAEKILRMSSNEQTRENFDLKQQLADKEKQLNTYAHEIVFLDKKIADIKNSCDYYMNRANDLLIKNQDKIEFAIAELQRVETYFEKHGSISYYIYHRINELKEMK